MPKVRVTLFPDREIEVPEDEIPVLRAQGLLREEPQPEPPSAPVKVTPKPKET